MLQGDLFVQRARTPKCKEHMGIARYLLSELDLDEDGSVERIFRRWTISRPRDPEEGLDAQAPVMDPSHGSTPGPTIGHGRLPVLE
jgi:hypothetical protein